MMKSDWLPGSVRPRSDRPGWYEIIDKNDGCTWSDWWSGKYWTYDEHCKPYSKFQQGRFHWRGLASDPNAVPTGEVKNEVE